MGSRSHASASAKQPQEAQPAFSFTPEPPQVQAQRDEPQLQMPEWSPYDNPFGNLFSPSFSAPSPIQAKLTVGAVGDKYEQEADAVAAQVVQQINAPGVGGAGVQREQGEAEREGTAIQREEMPEEEDLQMKPMLQRVGVARPDAESLQAKLATDVTLVQRQNSVQMQTTARVCPIH
ncbi:MAG: hypothetical protein O2890_01770 [Cyanobacteria bacterium]|nr:hypothetical protein [Cyanobacteriota bacterium]MDA0865147.1 hypothetical protein [Cyanobacteriota bacterium]